MSLVERLSCISSRQTLFTKARLSMSPMDFLLISLVSKWRVCHPCVNTLKWSSPPSYACNPQHPQHPYTREVLRYFNIATLNGFLLDSYFSTYKYNRHSREVCYVFATLASTLWNGSHPPPMLATHRIHTSMIVGFISSDKIVCINTSSTQQTQINITHPSFSAI